MMGLKRRVEWLENDIARVREAVNGLGFSGGLADDVKQLKRDVAQIQNNIRMIMEYLDVDVDLGTGPKLVTRVPVDE